MSLRATGRHNKIIAQLNTIATNDLNDWGPQPDCIVGESHSRGLLLDKRHDDQLETERHGNNI